MHLTTYTDYSLRVLIYLVIHMEKPTTIQEIADFYKISKNHLVKVVHQLGGKGFVATRRGKNGGIRLARAPEQIGVGQVVRAMEPGFQLAECFGRDRLPCTVLPRCNLKPILEEAGDAFLGMLDRYTLADLVLKESGLAHVLSRRPARNSALQ